MEDDKLAEYYDDLTRRGGGAARFKQGLGFSADAASANNDAPARGSAIPSTSSFLGSFVRGSSAAKTAEFEKQAELKSIQNKLSKKPKEKNRNRSLSRRSRSRSRSRDRGIDKHRKRKSRSRERNSRPRSRSAERRSRRSRSREVERRGKYRHRSKSRDKSRESRRQRSPDVRRSQKDKKLGGTSGGGGIDFAKSIEGYDTMTPAERIKVKMKLQLSKTAENDEMIGKGSGWERFDFNKDAPLDDEEEIEAAEDDAMVVKNIGQSFRFSAVEAKREQQIKSSHDEAIFGGFSFPPPAETKDEPDDDTGRGDTAEEAPVSSLLSEQILTRQGGSWRDRARKT